MQLIAYLRFRVLNSKTSLLFAGQNDLFYDRYRFYDSFVASITHLFEVNLQSSSGLSFEFKTTVSFFKFASRTVLFLLAISPSDRFTVFAAHTSRVDQ